MGKSYQYDDEVLDFIKGGRLLYGIVKSVRTLIVWRANLAGETYVLAKTGVSVSASFTLH